MSFNELVQSVESSEEFKDFKLKHPDAVLCAGFFICDFHGEESKSTIDYLDKDRVFIFSLNSDESISLEEDELIKSQKNQLKEIYNKVTYDLDSVEEISRKAAQENNIHYEFNKIISVLQLYSGEETEHEETLIWNVTCMLENLVIVHLLIDSNTGKILKFQKKSVMDFVKRG